MEAKLKENIGFNNASHFYFSSFTKAFYAGFLPKGKGNCRIANLFSTQPGLLAYNLD